jgi:5-methyltetrahydropteroyltriglutamate--homocysteine methyltransferase
VPLADIIDIVLMARPNAISFEAANPRHAHEWALFERVKLPDGKLLIPGVIESKSNFIEHPELIAQRWPDGFFVPADERLLHRHDLI